VQAVLADGSGLFMGVEPAGPAALTARVCLARPGGEMALFVCEAPWHGTPERFVAGGLNWLPGCHVRYGGPAVLYGSPDAFVDLEGGLRSAGVVDVKVEVSLSRGPKTSSRDMGYVRFRDRSVEVLPLLVHRRGGRFAGQHGVRGRMTLIGPDGVPIVIEDAHTDASATASAAAQSSIAGTIELVHDEARIRARSESIGLEIEGEVTVRVPVYRPAADGAFVRVVFGVAQIVVGQRFGARAVFEVIRKVRATM
jgi:hypothetical protein